MENWFFPIFYPSFEDLCHFMQLGKITPFFYNKFFCFGLSPWSHLYQWYVYFEVAVSIVKLLSNAVYFLANQADGCTRLYLDIFCLDILEIVLACKWFVMKQLCQCAAVNIYLQWYKGTCDRATRISWSNRPSMRNTSIRLSSLVCSNYMYIWVLTYWKFHCGRNGEDTINFLN